ncbi:hypothetical protein MFS40622_1373 [Methanocaldococcus sp. FS406-22]|uniref:hypothetical protein n=1 Tax=Methanocaldococcus sp. (strain FS406-22) TaxID=644281 RepID=UPI0001BF4803|nr:hypothetical protein [Methanocaldococcus sp. FS406-22]ADC70049.1 hypothetical protein MFS40622_1373 [Methanocaldococcus sp. FS406-22]
MKFLEKGVYKIFGAIVLVSMVGALVAEPVALGDVGWYLGHKLGDKAGTYVGEKLSDNEYVIKGAGHVGSYLGGRIGWRAGMTIGAEIGALAGPEGAIIGAAVGAF